MLWKTAGYIKFRNFPELLLRIDAVQPFFGVVYSVVHTGFIEADAVNDEKAVR